MSSNQKTAQPIIVWFRNDLRVHDHPALARAARDGSEIVPVFVLDPSIYAAKTSSANRNRFLLDCLKDLKQSLKKVGADLMVREGDPRSVLPELARDTGASAVYFSADYTPRALKRDRQVTDRLKEKGVGVKVFPGRLALDDITSLTTKAGTPHKVFTPFFRSWSRLDRRSVAARPTQLRLPRGVAVGTLPALKTIAHHDDLSPDAQRGGETAGRAALAAFLDGPIDAYVAAHNDLAADGTSRLSAYLHFGCLSPREIETQLGGSQGAQVWHRQLAWRDFYHYVLYHNPTNTIHEFQEKYRTLSWRTDAADLKTWQDGMTGYPIVDAAMRQLRREGWMHNRARLIVGSFLTKDLWLDWRLGEAYFMTMLIDGDTANNNGNWQWIASVGVDPAPVYRRLYNPSRQAKTYDPDGAYVRRYVPELKHIPDKYLAEPWTMPDDEQAAAGCRIGTDYPAPMVDHAVARRAALEHYRSV